MLFSPRLWLIYVAIIVAFHNQTPVVLVETVVPNERDAGARSQVKLRSYPSIAQSSGFNKACSISDLRSRPVSHRLALHRKLRHFRRFLFLIATICRCGGSRRVSWSRRMRVCVSVQRDLDLAKGQNTCQRLVSLSDVGSNRHQPTTVELLRHDNPRLRRSIHGTCEV